MKVWVKENVAVCRWNCINRSKVNIIFFCNCKLYNKANCRIFYTLQVKTLQVWKNLIVNNFSAADNGQTVSILCKYSSFLKTILSIAGQLIGDILIKYKLWKASCMGTEGGISFSFPSSDAKIQYSYIFRSSVHFHYSQYFCQLSQQCVYLKLKICVAKQSVLDLICPFLADFWQYFIA